MPQLKPLYTVEKLDDDQSPLTAKFRYVDGYERPYLWGLVGPAQAERWVTTTFPAIREELGDAQFSLTLNSHSLVPAFADASRIEGLEKIAARMAEQLDFSDYEFLLEPDDGYGIG